jgi:hypothetical protein
VHLGRLVAWRRGRQLDVPALRETIVRLMSGCPSSSSSAVVHLARLVVGKQFDLKNPSCRVTVRPQFVTLSTESQRLRVRHPVVAELNETGVGRYEDVMALRFVYGHRCPVRPFVVNSGHRP